MPTPIALIEALICGLLSSFFLWYGGRLSAKGRDTPKCHRCGSRLRPVKVTPLQMDGFLDPMPQNAVWYCPGVDWPRHELIYYGPREDKPEPLTEL